MNVASPDADRVLDLICQREGNIFTHPAAWFDAFEYAVLHTTVLTTGIRSEQNEYVKEFIAIAPTRDEMHSAQVSARTITKVWMPFAEHMYDPHNRLTVHVNLINKLVELTNMFITRGGPPDAVRKLWSNVDHFYKQAIAWNEPKVAFTAFGFSKLMNAYTLADIATLPEFPAELIEEHAFGVPRVVAEQFVKHPNTPERLRTLIQVSLPQMEQVG